MFIRPRITGVVDDDIKHDVHTELVCLRDKLFEIRKRAEVRVDRKKVLNRIPMK
jgi:hypothetical protein